MLRAPLSVVFGSGQTSVERKLSAEFSLKSQSKSQQGNPSHDEGRCIIIVSVLLSPADVSVHSSQPLQEAVGVT